MNINGTFIAPSQVLAQKLDQNEPAWEAWDGGVNPPVELGHDCEARFKDGDVLRSYCGNTLNWRNVAEYRVWPAQNQDEQETNQPVTVEESDDELNRAAVSALMQRVYCLSYNDSYCGERTGAVKQAVIEWWRQKTRVRDSVNNPASTATERQTISMSADEYFERITEAARAVSTNSPEQERERMRFELAKAAITGIGQCDITAQQRARIIESCREAADLMLAELERTK